MRYILSLYLTKNYSEELTDSTFYTLCQLATQKEISTYQICNTLKNTDYKIEYKNVHKKIQRFLSLKLIVKTKKKDFKHASIYYKLSDTGVFHILLNMYKKIDIFQNQELIRILKGLIYNYDDNDFHHIFIYPYFYKKTILNISSKPMLENFLYYCSLCCNQVLRKLFSLYYLNEFFVPLNWSDLVGFINERSSKDKIERWLASLKNRFNTILNPTVHGCLDWLDKDAELNFIDENTVTVKKDRNELRFNLDKYKKKAFLIYNKKNLIEYDVISENNDYKINILDERERFKNLLESHILDYSIFRMYDFEKSVLIPFIMEGRFRDTDKNYWKRIEKDIILLINDDKFYKMVIDTIKQFDRFCNNILEYRNQ